MGVAAPYLGPALDRIITARKRSLGQGNIFSSVCQEFCPQLGGRAWQILRDTVNERPVHILLECILVNFVLESFMFQIVVGFTLSLICSQIFIVQFWYLDEKVFFLSVKASDYREAVRPVPRAAPPCPCRPRLRPTCGRTAAPSWRR